jgi:hypothetical protein
MEANSYLLGMGAIITSEAPEIKKIKGILGAISCQ